MRLYNVYFSAKGTTRLCADCIAEGLNLEKKDYDWLTASEPEKIAVSSEDALLFSMPVYGGYIPKLCAERAAALHGDHTPAIIAAVYGNRHYDNALLQMKDLLESQGFHVIAAGAFLAEHSIFPTVAEGRPDEKDLAAMREFAGKCAKLLQEEELWRGKEIALPGNPDYDASVSRAFPSIRKEMRIVRLRQMCASLSCEGDCQRESTKDGRGSVHFMRRLHQGMPGKGKRLPGRGLSYGTKRF